MKVKKKRIFEAEQWFANKTMPGVFQGAVCMACTACPAPHVHTYTPGLTKPIGSVTPISEGYWLVDTQAGEFAVYSPEEFNELFVLDIPKFKMYNVEGMSKDDYLTAFGICYFSTPSECWRQYGVVSHFKTVPIDEELYLVVWEGDEPTDAEIRAKHDEIKAQNKPYKVGDKVRITKIKGTGLPGAAVAGGWGGKIGTVRAVVQDDAVEVECEGEMLLLFHNEITKE